MKLSTRSRYGLRALLDIATHNADGPVRLREIARRQQVSLPYLEHIIGSLVSGGVLKSTRGVGGGVSLRQQPDRVSVREVVHLLEGSLTATDCVHHPDVCSRSSSCATRQLWVEVTEAMDGVLSSKSLADLISFDDGGGRTPCAPEAVQPMRQPVFGGRQARVGPGRGDG